MDAHRKWLVWAGMSIAAMICVALVLLVLSMNVDRFSFPAHESAAVGSLRRIIAAQNEFRSAQGCFADRLGELPSLTFHDDAYSYIVLPRTKDDKGCVTRYIVTASPSPWWKKQKAHYFAMDQSETLHYEPEHAADENSPVLDQPPQSR
jgi:hypothetical protein